MGKLLEIGAGMVSQSQRRVEVAAHNIANLTTPGYKRQSVFSTLAPDTVRNESGRVSEAIVADFSAGRNIATGNKNDLAIAGDGYFAVRAGERIVYTRAGQFERQGDGRLTSANGFVVQAKGGGDLVLKAAEFEVTRDGVVLQGDEPVAKFSIVAFDDEAQVRLADGGAFATPDSNVRELLTPSIAQGALEASNVSTGDEMVAMMEALRRAEAGQKVVNTYDDLLGRALTSFGQN